MMTTAKFATVAALAGDPARAAMLNVLMDGRALTASELAGIAGITPQTASGHLARLEKAGLLTLHKQGRHRYFGLASVVVAEMVESIMRVAAAAYPESKPLFVGPKDDALRAARTCYDHLAGRLGVAIADALVERGYARLSDDGGEISPEGLSFFAELGITLPSSPAKYTGGSKRLLCRPCLDWSERRIHIAGVLGAAICNRSLEADWVRRAPTGRIVTISPKGQQVFRTKLGIREF